MAIFLAIAVPTSYQTASKNLARLVFFREKQIGNLRLGIERIGGLRVEYNLSPIRCPEILERRREIFEGDKRTRGPSPEQLRCTDQNFRRKILSRGRFLRTRKSEGDSIPIQIVLK